MTQVLIRYFLSWPDKYFSGIQLMIFQIMNYFSLTLSCKLQLFLMKSQLRHFFILSLRPNEWFQLCAERNEQVTILLIYKKQKFLETRKPKIVDYNLKK